MRYLALIFLLVFPVSAFSGGESQPPLLTVSHAMAGTDPGMAAKLTSLPDDQKNASPQPTRAVPDSYSARYTASYNGLPVKTLRQFSRDGNRYVLSTKAENFLGKIIEEERFDVSAQGEILPLSYKYNRAIFGKVRTEQTLFKATDNLAINTYKGKTVEFPLEKSLLAPLSYQVKMRQDLRAGKKSFHYRVVYRNHIKDYHYGIIREEVIDSPIGKLNTIVLQRIREDSERETYLWLAISLDYLPVKLIQKEDGETHEMLIESYQAGKS